ncbi:hypothetical protein [Salipiger thiooxidans]|uniref:hypothetical protein n=1 Tax=Salipiger thiooxidans TaxID=282683 RepID=UPI001CFBDF11|nr:hypothetical protein [Salipiger thiooxidans]
MHTISSTASILAQTETPSAADVATAFTADMRRLAMKHIDGSVDMGLAMRRAEEKLARMVLRELHASDKAFAPVARAWADAQACVHPMSVLDHGDMLGAIEDFEEAARVAAMTMRDEAANYCGESAA